MHRIVEKKKNDDEEKLLGVLAFSNMIPVNEKYYNEINLRALINSNDEKMRKYYFLLKKEYDFCNKNIHKLRAKASTLHNSYTNNTLNENLRKLCCNFTLLEKACLDYERKTTKTNKLIIG